MKSPHVGWKIRYFFASLIFHAAVFAIFYVGVSRKSSENINFRTTISLELHEKFKKEQNQVQRHTPSKVGRPYARRKHSKPKLSPPFLQNLAKGISIPKGRTTGEGEFQTETSRQFSRDLLETESKVWDVFDKLAGKINGHLDYPEILFDYGIQGNATLDLYFDSKGEIDEVKSTTFGNNRLVRGMLVRATRKALVEWLFIDTQRLRKEQFRNQHFRADFVIAYSQMDKAELTKFMPGSYGFMRRRVSNVSCIANVGGSLGGDFACAVISLGGAIRRSVSDKYKNKFTALKDTLELYDNLNLTGINTLARSKT